MSERVLGKILEEKLKLQERYEKLWDEFGERAESDLLEDGIRYHDPKNNWDDGWFEGVLDGMDRIEDLIHEAIQARAGTP